MLSTIGWNFIIVVHTEDASEEAREFSAIANANGVCISDSGTPDSDTVQKIFHTIKKAYNTSLAVVYFGNNAGAEYIVKETRNARPYGSTIHWVFTSQFSNNIEIENNIIASKDSMTAINLHDPVNLTEFKNFLNDRVLDTPLQTLIQYYNFSVHDLTPEINPFPMVDAILSTILSVKRIWENVCDRSTTITDCSLFKQTLRTELVNKITVGVQIPEEISRKYLPPGHDRIVIYQNDGSQMYNTLYYKMYASMKVGRKMFVLFLLKLFF